MRRRPHACFATPTPTQGAPAALVLSPKSARPVAALVTIPLGRRHERANSEGRTSPDAWFLGKQERRARRSSRPPRVTRQRVLPRDCASQGRWPHGSRQARSCLCSPWRPPEGESLLRLVRCRRRLAAVTHFCSGQIVSSNLASIGHGRRVRNWRFAGPRPPMRLGPASVGRQVPGGGLRTPAVVASWKQSPDSWASGGVVRGANPIMSPAGGRWIRTIASSPGQCVIVPAAAGWLGRE